MSLTVDRNLADILLCGLPEYLGLTTNRTIQTAGTPAENKIVFPGNKLDGDTMRLKWIGNDHTFTFRNTPDDSGFEVPVVNSTITFNNFITALENNYYINRDYTVTVVSDVAPYEFHLVARENGAQYTMDNGVFGGLSILVAGVDDVYNQNLSVFMQVFAEIDGTWEEVQVIDSSVSNEGSLKLFPGRILRALFDLVLPYTEITGAGIDKYHRFFPSAGINYYLKYYEKYGDPAVAAIGYNFGTEAAPKLAVDFSLDKVEIPGADPVTDYFTDTAARQVLTAIKTKRARSGYVDFPSIYLEAGSTGAVSCKVDYYFTDASSALNLLTFGTKTITSATDAQIYEFAMVFDAAIAYADSQGKVIDYIQVYFDSNVGGVSVDSEKITYENETSVADQFHLFLYKNPRGTWSTTYFTGYIKNLKEYERVEAQILARTDFDKSTSDIFTYNHLEQDLFELATGLLSADELSDLTEFANSEEVYILDGDFDTETAFWRPVIIQPDAFTEVDDSEGNMESKIFKFKNAYFN